MKKFFVMLLTVVSIFSAFLVMKIDSAQASDYSGSCGDNVTWELNNETGLLKICGSGAMIDYSWDSIPWAAHKESIINVDIEIGVENLCNYAFSECSNLKSINIPSSVTIIGKSAFYNCTSLTSVCIPYGVKSIMHGTFENCSSLINATLPDSVILIDNWAFYGCVSLISINIPNEVTKIGSYAFDRCTSLTSINIPEKLTYIGVMAFDGCQSLTGVYATSIETWCNIKFDGGCQSNPLRYAHNLYINGELAENIIIPDKVKSIRYYAFYGCTSLTDVCISSSVTKIGDKAFYYCSNLASVSIPDSISQIGDNAFYGCFNLQSVNIEDIASWCNIEFADGYSNPMLYAQKFYINGELAENIAISEGIQLIKSNAFYGCKSIISLTIPSSLNAIAANAFYDCLNLKNLYYTGTKEQWEKISVSSGNECFKNIVPICGFGKYCVYYNACGGDNAPSSQIKELGVDIRISGKIPTKKNSIFIGWSTDKDGLVSYQPGDLYSLNSDITLYAVWEEKPYTQTVITPRKNFDLIDVDLVNLPTECFVIFSIYSSDDTLINVQIDTYTNERVSFVEYNDYKYAKVMVWNGTGNMQPLTSGEIALR